MKTKRMNGVKSAITMVAMAVALMVGGTSVKAADVNVDGGATKAASKRLNYNTNYVAHFDGAGSNDWYVIKPTGQNNFYEIVIKNFNISTGGNGYYGFHAYVMNGAGDVYMDIDTHKNEQTVTKVKLRDIKEDLYIKFEVGEGFKENSPKENSGNYRIAINTVKDDCGDTMATATSISYRKTYTRKMEDWYNLDPTIINEDNGLWDTGLYEDKSDVDFFRFKAPQSGYYTLRLKNINMPSGGNSGHTLNAEVLSGYEEQLAKVDSGKGEVHECKIKLKKNQTCYIRVHLGEYVPQNIGNYQVSVWDNDYLSAIKAPSNAKATVSGKKVKLSWKKNSAVKSYTIYRSVNGKSYKKIATVNKNSYVDKKVSKNKKYQYKIVSSKMTDKTNVLSKAKSAKTKKVRVK